jgi:hypothetical protein
VIRRSRTALALAALAISLSGCALAHPGSLQWRVDKRLHFVSPEARAKVGQPVTISWRMTDFRVAPLGSEPPSKDVGYFAIFVDRGPLKPGQTMQSVVGGATYCRQIPRCTSRSELRQRNVFTTTATSFRFPVIPDLTTDDSVQLHTFTIVLMDTSGHRIGESSWELDLRIPKGLF